MSAYDTSTEAFQRSEFAALMAAESGMTLAEYLADADSDNDFDTWREAILDGLAESSGE